MDDETREYFEALRHELGAMREEMGVRLGAIDARFDGVAARIDGVEARFDGVDDRFDGVDDRFDGVEARFDSVNDRFDSVHERITAEHEATRRYFDVVAQDLRHDLQAVAEGVVSNTRAIDELRSDVYRDMDRRFSLVHLAFGDLRRQLTELRDRGTPG